MSAAQPLVAVERYYTDKVRRHGPTPQGVDWNGAASQRSRFEQLLAILDDVDGEVRLLDYGCGYGALLDVLAERRDAFAYQGFDVSPAMIAIARERAAGDPRAVFTDEASALRPADFTVASGIFNVKLEADDGQWRRYVEDTLDRMVRLSRRGVAFNALTAHSDPERMQTHLHYADPAALLDRCLRRYSRDAALRHDYELYEFTMLLRLDRRPPVTQELNLR